MGPDLRAGTPRGSRKSGAPKKEAADKAERMFYFAARPKLAKALSDVYHAGEYSSYAECFRDMLTFAMMHGYKPKGTEFDKEEQEASK